MKNINILKKSIIGAMIVSVLFTINANAVIHSSYYDVTLYGATGNGSTNDAPAIQAAIDAARLAGGGTVYFPGQTSANPNNTGKYRLNSTLFVGTGTGSSGIDAGNNVHFLGDSRNESRLLAPSTGDCICFRGNSTSPSERNYLSGFSILRDAGVGTSGSAINLSGAWRTNVKNVWIWTNADNILFESGIRITQYEMCIEDVTITNAQYGIRATGSFNYGTIKYCRTWNCDYGIHISGDIRAVTIEDCNFSSGDYGVYCNGFADNKIINNVIEDNSVAGVYVYTADYWKNCGLIIQNNYFEHNGIGQHKQIWMVRSGTNNIARAVIISGNFFSFYDVGGVISISPYDIPDASQLAECTFINNSWINDNNSSVSECGITIGAIPIAKEWNSQSRFAVNGSMAVKVISKTGTYTAGDETVILVNNTGSVDIDLPSASSVPGRMYTIKKISNNTSVVYIDPYGSEQIEGSTTSLSFSTYNACRQIISNGSKWYWIGSR